MRDHAMSREAVERLRQSAHERDRNGCNDALGAALSSVNREQARALAEDILRRGLPTFERNHPGQSWPRDALDGRTDELPPEYEGPGGNSFAMGVLALVDARASDEPAAHRALIVDSLTYAIMAERCAVWGAAHPDEWRRSYAAALDENASYADDPMRGWYEDPAVIRRERELWTDLAARLEALLAGPLR